VYVEEFKTGHLPSLDIHLNGPYPRTVSHLSSLY